MNKDRAGRAAVTDKSKQKIVHIIGPLKLQNAMIAYYLESMAAIPCADLTPDDVIPVPADAQAGPIRLFLIDCFKGHIEKALDGFNTRQKKTIFQYPLALFNVKPRTGVEQKGIPLKIRGFFYMCDKPETLLAGIEAIFDGKIWIPDELKARYQRGLNGRTAGGSDGEHLFTPRELQILALVAEGLRNEQVALRLCISFHTVKTHMYNIIKKIGVSNRRQAVLWAMINLPDFLNLPADGGATPR